ncbi:Cystathionine beta-synthase, putative [Coccidioides posadasii C735 delta SOWgp]|uniref:cystathionine beta-synthase n=4 Tax=Coccidioides posadasii TaxID=199306 RepID=E9D7A9_COCPS|nr:Cystathionine beta-synthase, putative [Coccidioides posadasii C735 delta SOWgp]EER25665.1 Cystathionine beta-synthase, putative [Coccidioides posadasii C735 delta SOWgp]EFW17268.1 cystathionine beta-synthase [Coccidioides posadasii str. Silveira]KMM71089.1 cystathionine beta-synthase [Coccidioides posadasii RMSCC 3488]|eukprot:XP_003067810.1 Cystathionine beta-synthase, putative [Coccidioides posadasii C735 delta SOWgp]
MAAPFLGQLMSDSVADYIGGTPLVRLNRVPAALGIKAQVYAKLEYFNAGGSVKDRIAKHMIEQAERDGVIKPGDTLIEASSGNTGIAIALMAAIKGYKCIITLSEKMSLEKEQILHALGARVVRTPAGVPIDSPDSIISVAKRLRNEIPRSFILDQYTNPANPAAHEFGTAEEIWHQTQGKVDAVISGAGTGGTITGIAKGMKKHNPDVFLVGVDPVGSILAIPERLNETKGEYKVEGIGYDFLPDVLDQTSPDLWVKTTDKDSFKLARRLVREEGLLCGGSAGATVAALVQFMEQHPEFNKEEKLIVLILADGLRNYLTKFADDNWMKQNGYAVDAGA